MLVELIRMDDPANYSALKVLHQPKDARDSERAEVRIKNEIRAMQDISHPNLLEIIDSDTDGKWFVSKLHRKGTLIENKRLFTGNFAKSLRAFRPLVEGVSQLHQKGSVHRDIKPQNVFLDSDDNLVLGDFGLVFFTDDEHTRISGTWENVGSRDWMPGWALGMKIEDIRPTFDVFSLGKLLWAMVSDKQILRLWYHDKPEFDIRQSFPDDPHTDFSSQLFRECIVENEDDCLPDATVLLERVDQLLSLVDRNADLIGEDIKRPCKVCGIGDYRPIVDRNVADTHDFGLRPYPQRSFKIFVCSHCGNVQLFAFDGEIPPAWSKSANGLTK